MADYRKRIAEAIAFARESAGLSQRELADRLKRDKRTLQKWEKGEIKLSLEDFFEIFEALRVPVEPYSKWIRHPELFPRGMPDIVRTSTDRKRDALVTYYREQASPVEIEQDYYIFFGDHGSNFYGMRQQRVANLQTPLRDRKRICRQVIDNYNEAVEAGTLTEPNAPQPNMEILIACYEASVESIREGRNQYALGDLQDRRASQKETDAEKSEKSK